MKLDKRLLSLVDAHRAALLLILAASLAGGVVIVLQARLLSQTIGQVFLGGAGLEGVSGSLIWLFLLLAARSLLVWAGELASGRMAIEIKTDLRETLLAKLQALGPGYAKESPGQEGVRTGEIAALALEGVENLDAYFAQYLPQLAASAIVPLTLLIFIFPLDRLSGFILLVTAPLIPLFMILIGDRAEAETRRQWSLLSRMSAHFLDVLQGLPTLKLFGRSRAQVQVIAQVGERYRETTLGVLKIAFLSALALELVATLSTAVVAVEIGLRVLYGRLAFDNALFVLLLAPEFYLPLRLLGSRFHAGMGGIASAQSLFSILETPAQEYRFPPDSRSGASLRPGEPVSIRFEEVSYAFPGERSALDRVTFQIPARKVTALVGASGAGKSTLVDLLLRFLQSQAGQIWVNGTPLEVFAPEDWRQSIAWVPQTPYLFDTTVLENIRLGRPEASFEEVRAAAMHAYAHEFIQFLPQGYETPLGEQAARLSLGQAQRLALARAFLKDAPVLILDEPATHLDPAHAELVDRAVRRLAQGRTVLVIAHRLPTVAAADHLILLDQGRVVQAGAPAELLNQDGRLRSLFPSLPDILADQAMSQEHYEPPASEVVSYPQGRLPDRQIYSLTSWGLFYRLVNLLQPYWGRAALSILLGFAATACFIGLLATSAYLISAAALQPSIAALQVAIVGVRFFGLSRGVFRYLERYLSHDVTLRLLAQLRTRFYAALEPLAPARLQDLHGGDLLTRFNADLVSLEGFYVRAILPPGAALLVLVATTAFLSAFSPFLSLVLACLYLAAGIGLPLLAGLASRSPGGQLVAVRSRLVTAIVESTRGMSDLQVFNAQNRQLGKIGALNQSFAALQQRLTAISSLQSAGMTLLSQAAAWGVLVIAIPLVSGGQISGTVLASLVLASLASFEAVTPLPMAAQTLTGSLAAARRLFSVIEAPPQVVDSSDPIPLPAKQSSATLAGPKSPPDLEVRHLNFSYLQGNPLSPIPSSSPPRNVLDNISFCLPAGKKIALVGASGEGKTTLVNLLVRFWDYHDGEIRLSGLDLRSYSQEEVRKQLSVVPQQVHLFNATVHENLLLARPKASQEQIEQAARLARLHEFIASLPDGYGTWIGEQGLRLSGGQRQRLAIARALLKDSPILILDEPTAHLDPTVEREVVSAVLESQKEKSILLITHRLVQMDRMDEILVLSQGRLLERGRHADLLAAKGLYWHLWVLQNQAITD